MDAQLLATRTRIPPLTHRLVHRARLVDALEAGIPEHRLVLVSAPAGYGKTTLLADWAQSSRFPVAWCTLGEDDNEPEHLLRLSLAAWESIDPQIRESPLGLLLEGAWPDIDSVLRAVIAVANELSGHIVLVLDDVHHLMAPAVHQALTFLVDNLPPKLHVVLAGRSDPPLPIARYRARQELVEVRVDELQFIEDEAEALMNTLMELDLGHDEVESLRARLEGWVAGLLLAALTVRHRPLKSGPLDIGGTSRYIADYLSEEVVAGLSDETRRFLLETSILDSMDGNLCDAVTGRNDSQRMLEFLERSNLFVVPLDDRREWFRYHRIFADLLQQELANRLPNETSQLHCRAARWFLDNDLPERAFPHAIEGGDAELAVHIADRYVYGKLSIGEFMVVRRWLEMVPDAWLEAYPMFGVARSGLMILSGQFEAGLHCLDDVEQVAQASGVDQSRVLARVTAIRCLVACVSNDLPRAEHFAEIALRELHEDDYDFRAGIHGSLGDSYRANGRWAEARSWYLKTLGFTQSSVAQIQFANVYGALADLELMRGRLRDAATYWRKALAIMQDRAIHGNYTLPMIGWVYLRMAELLYEWNDLVSARDHVSRGLERAELGGDTRALIAGCLVAGRIELAEGNVQAANDYLERARALVTEAPFPEWISQFERFQLEAWLAQDRLRAAVEWSDQMHEDAVEGSPEREAATLAVARVLIVRGDAAARRRALDLLDASRQSAASDGLTGTQIERLALEAMARRAGGDAAGAMTSLEQALRHAEPEGYVRLFVDLGLPMARLLQEARSRDVLPGYVDTLLAAAGEGIVVGAAGTKVLPEPLSAREHEVLTLMVAGLTNREIGESLSISPQTVKKHADNIYGKLGVRGRTRAAARARELGLLG